MDMLDCHLLYAAGAILLQRRHLHGIHPHKLGSRVKIELTLSRGGLAIHARERLHCGGVGRDHLCCKQRFGLIRRSDAVNRRHCPVDNRQFTRPGASVTQRANQLIHDTPCKGPRIGAQCYEEFIERICSEVQCARLVGCHFNSGSNGPFSDAGDARYARHARVFRRVFQTLCLLHDILQKARTDRSGLADYCRVYIRKSIMAAVI